MSARKLCKETSLQGRLQGNISGGSCNTVITTVHNGYRGRRRLYSRACIYYLLYSRVMNTYNNNSGYKVAVQTVIVLKFGILHQILRRVLGQGQHIFPFCSAHHEKDWHAIIHGWLYPRRPCGLVSGNLAYPLVVAETMMIIHIISKFDHWLTSCKSAELTSR